MVNGYTPTTLAEALEIRAKEQVTPFAGGTDLMIRGDENAHYLFLHKIKEMREISEDDSYLKIGATCTFSEILASTLCPAILGDALSKIAAPAIRNIGTIGENLGNGSAKADSVLIFFVTDAKLRLAGSSGERIIPIKDFYQCRKKLDLRPEELIVEVWMPKTALQANYRYEKIAAREALAISRVSFAALIVMEDRKVQHLATAFGAVSDVVIRRDDLDKMLIGLTIEEAKHKKQDYLAAMNEAIVPIRGRVSSEYRKSVCENLLEDFLNDYIK